MSHRVAIFVDGENINTDHVETIRRVALKLGRPVVQRVYGDVGKIAAWQEHCDFNVVHAGTGKNAADLMIAVDAMELAMMQRMDRVVLASSDQDFRHLTLRLREYNLSVIGIGQGKTHEKLKSACTRFVELRAPNCESSLTATPANEPLSKRYQQVCVAISQNSNDGKGMPLTTLGHYMREQHKFVVSSTQYKTWRGFLSKRTDVFDLDPRGPQARVRLVTPNIL